MRAGKHVFCEKPMSLTVEACLEMERAAEEADRRLMIGHCLRYWPQYVKAREILASGELRTRDLRKPVSIQSGAAVER